MSVKAICINGYWTVRTNWRKRRMSHRVEPNTETRALEVVEATKTALRLYGLDAFKLFEKPKEPAGENPTLQQFAERWEQEMDKSDLKFSTKKMYASNLKHHILPALGSSLVSDIDYATLKSFLISKRDASYSSGRFRKGNRKYKKAHNVGYSRDSVRIMAMTLRALMQEAVREKLIPDNPVKDLAQFYRKRKKDREVTRSQVYTLEELYKIEDQLREKRILFGDCYEMSMALSRTGMRIGEARGINWNDIDWNGKTIHVGRNIPSGTNIEEDTTKTESGERDIDMSNELAETLKRLKVRTASKSLKDKKKGPRNPFPIRYEEFHEAWSRAQKLAKVKYRSPHSIRHTWASQQLAAGADIAWVSKQLGHSSPAVTLAIYSHFIPGRKPQGINALDRSKSGNANKMQIELKS